MQAKNRNAQVPDTLECGSRWGKKEKMVRLASKFIVEKWPDHFGGVMKRGEWRHILEQCATDVECA